MPPADVELLAAQCSDLERLLSLAKDETEAAREGRFTRIWDIVTERSIIGKRLETFHQQIAELRSALESHGENPTKYDITNRVIELANLTLIQDQETPAGMRQRLGLAITALGGTVPEAKPAAEAAAPSAG